ncbi:ECF RNA polymerase sigma factor SigW [Paenibacillus marchantiophytorum]|uniref:RNA polymerase sigma factor n=1 Tax=Paenibacillus marchantiophytorum TaxID=1619310 RepID=A0ABQ1EMB2_9BACL|nr:MULTISPECIES: sigma-70 family RNA polymerase sigma factor [Paenibacillus]UKS27426.1 sigma-70 family RNA polymerase sigma factor [Paenibacillus sp. HWE-109]GFZ77387.1 ECF RNA polymerase sigma factor SigW [Paenibacillus marchantiophytorum]
MLQLNDSQLAALWSQGDSKAFNRLLELYKDKIYRLAYRMLRNKSDSEDVVQETFLRAYLHSHRFDTTKNFSSWIFSIGKNVTIDVLRKKKSELSMDTNPNPFQDSLPFYEKLTSQEKTPELQLIELETAAQVERMIQDLPDKYKNLIVYKYYLDMSLEDISKEVNLPVSTIKTRLFRGRNYIKRKWGSLFFLVQSLTSVIIF